MSRLLLTFCNQRVGARRNALLLVETYRERVRTEWIPIGVTERDMGGATGLEIDPATGKIYVVVQSIDLPRLVVLDHYFRVIDVIELYGVKDPHSLELAGDALYIASTGNNRIYRLDLKTRKLEIYWQFPNVNPDMDRAHLNSLCMCPDGLYFSAFGWRTVKGSWERRGIIARVQPSEGISAKLERIAQRLFHPHSLMYHDGKIYFLESADSIFSRVERNKEGGYVVRRVSVSPKMYLRGLCLAKGGMLVGGSTYRTTSRSRGTTCKPLGELVSSRLIHLGMDGSVTTLLDLEDYGPEIYEIAVQVTRGTDS
jgi:hypothetical protein